MISSCSAWSGPCFDHRRIDRRLDCAIRLPMILYFSLIIISCLIIWRASNGFEVASTYLGRNLGDGVRGATINAIGSSMPELFTTFWFLFVMHDRDGFAGGIATTAGSAIFNGMIIPAVVILSVLGFGLATRVSVSRRVILRDGIALILAEIILILVIRDSSLNWWHGMILMLVYVIYVFLMIKTMQRNQKNDTSAATFNIDVPEKRGSRLKNLLTLDLEPLFIHAPMNTISAWRLLLVAMVIIGGSCALLVHACEKSALALGIHTYFVAVVLASAATSVPDTILSYKDAMVGEYDDAVANALGSNIFDVCFALGFPLFIYTATYGPLTMSAETVENVTELRVILLGSTILAFLIYIIRSGMGRIKAYLLLCIYFLFMLFIAGKAYEFSWALEFGRLLRSLLPI